MGMLHVCYRSFLFMRIDCKYMTYCIHTCILRTLYTYFLVVKGKDFTLNLISVRLGQLFRFNNETYSFIMRKNNSKHII